jgi:predicted short-subunit dehydrogenase-like oxidoreductase (DUF2520 family)
MRELDRHAAEDSSRAIRPAEPGGSIVGQWAIGRPEGEAPALRSIAIVGRGRAGSALARALRETGFPVEGPLGRGERPGGSRGNGSSIAPDAVLLCVPDAEITGAALAVAGSAGLVGHTSGATRLSALEPARRAGAELFGLHPLQSLTGEAGADRLAGAGCAIAGSSSAALQAARSLAERLSLTPFEIADEHRGAYHAAASTASNFLVTLQDAAEAIARGAGLTAEEARRALLPLVRATVESWAALGPEEALTGPVARGDEETVAAQREAVRGIEPSLLPLFDALVQRTRDLAARSPGGRPEAPPSASSIQGPSR